MLFSYSFLRITGAGDTLPPKAVAASIPVLGTDAAPTKNWGSAGVRPSLVPYAWPYSAAIPSGQSDNVMVARMKNKDGHPVRRIAISFLATSGAIAQVASLYAWEEGSQQWYLLTQASGASSPISLPPSGITYFDLPAIAEPMQTQRGGLSPAGDAGDLNVMLVPGTAAGQPTNGTYLFGMAPCMGTSRAGP